MGEAGSAPARFARALDTRNLLIIRAAAAELGRVSLGDALRILVIIGEQEPHLFEKAAVRWLGRLCGEQRDLTLEDVDHARAAVALLRTDPAGGLEVLHAIGAPGAAAAMRARAPRR